MKNLGDVAEGTIVQITGIVMGRNPRGTIQLYVPGAAASSQWAVHAKTPVAEISGVTHPDEMAALKASSDPRKTE